MDLDQLEKKLLKNKKIKKEFEKYDLAYEVSQMLLEARIIKGITQEKLAELAHTKQSGIARAERGSALPKLSFLNKLAIALKTRLIVKFAFMEKSDIKVVGNAKNTMQTVASIPHEYSYNFLPSYTINTETLKNSERVFLC